MKFYLIDAGGAGLVIGVLLIFMLLAIIVEGLTMLLIKYNKAGKAFLDALVINLVSLGAGYLVIFISGSINLADNDVVNFILIYLLTVLIEFVTLYFLNRSKPVKKTLLTAIVINIASYLLLFLFSILL